MARNDHSLLIPGCLLLALGLVSHSAAGQDTDWANTATAGIRAYQQKQYAEAERHFKTALEVAQKLSPNDDRLGTSYNNLAELCRTQGRHPEAEPLYQQALAIWERAWGPEHPKVANALNNLALVYQALSRYAEAEPLFDRSLAIREKLVGLEHAQVAASLNNLALLYYDQGRHAEAEPLYQRALAIWERALGPEHPNVALNLNNLALPYAAQGR